MPSKKNKRKDRRVSSEGDANAEDCLNQAVSTTSITQTISGTNIQIGHGNVIKDRRSFERDTSETSENTGSCSSLPVATVSGAYCGIPTLLNQNKTYAEAVSERVVKQIIKGDNVTINIHPNTNTTQNESEASTGTYLKRDQVVFFRDCVGNFSRGHFILVVGKQNSVEYINSLSLVPWTAVLDFDPESRSTGLLSCIESTLDKWRSLHVRSIKDSCSFSEHITNWIFLKGCADRPDTRTADEAGDWKKEIEGEIDKKLLQLQEFEAGITHFTFVVIWSPDSNTAKCMHFILGKVCTRMNSSIVIVDGGETKSHASDLNLNVLKEEKEVRVVELGVKEMCNVIGIDLKTIISESPYHLPTEDKTNDPRISTEMAQWLKEDFEVLYLDNTTGTEYSSQQIQEEEDNFHKGGTLPWAWWYEVGEGHVDVKRDIMKSIIDYIKSFYLDKSMSGTITLLHSPGSGGTTLSQRMLWSLKERTPCVQMKLNSGSTVMDLIEKICFLSDTTHMPILLLLDGEDEHRIVSLQMFARQAEICVVMLYVRRCSTEIDHHEHQKDVFFLHDRLSKREAIILTEKLKRKTKHESRLKNVKRLLEDVKNDKHRTIFEFGLAAHSYEYQGIQSYVSGHLKLSNTDEDPLPWQTSLAYLSLVYFYGHTSVPCHFFTDTLSSAENKRILETKDFPQEMQEFIVRGVNESRHYTVRISHYYLAKEILDQVLLRSCTIERCVSPYLCNEAKQLLATFCPRFIEKAGEVSDGNSSEVILKMLIKTFIKRENKDIFEDEGDETREKRFKGPNKPHFSQMLEDASSNAPFSERFDILQQLVASFPLEAQFRAHLGRLYMICRPEDEQKAEENLRKAYEMSSSVLDGKQSIENIPFIKRLDLRNICHMYGIMLSKKVFTYTGKCSTDKPVIVIEQDQFQTIAESLLPDVQRACQLFSQNREVMPPGYTNYLGFIGEIQVRLAYCRLVKENCGTDDLESFVMNNDGNVAEFVHDCYVVLDELFDDLCTVADTKNMMVGGQPLQEMYMDIMSPSVPGHMDYKLNKNTSTARRREIAKMKAKYITKTSHGFLEKLQHDYEIRFIVECYEKNFQVANLADKDLNSDYLEWIRAIRHPHCPERYSIEKVYKHVENWYQHVLKQNNPRKKNRSTFYYFVLSSLIGFGTFGKPGNVELLRKSQVLKKMLLEHSKYSQNPDYQVEWLGPPVQTIDRLIPGRRRFGGHEGLPLDEKDNERLEIWIGTICPSYKNATCGFIALDLGPRNQEHVNIHFVPKKWKMKGTSFQGSRVEFVIGFNMSHGYEAFFVKPIEHAKCSTDGCGNNIEKRSCDKEVKCPKCLKMTEV